METDASKVAARKDVVKKQVVNRARAAGALGASSGSRTSLSLSASGELSLSRESLSESKEATKHLVVAEGGCVPSMGCVPLLRRKTPPISSEASPGSPRPASPPPPPRPPRRQRPPPPPASASPPPSPTFLSRFSFFGGTDDQKQQVTEEKRQVADDDEEEASSWSMTTSFGDTGKESKKQEGGTTAFVQGVQRPPRRLLFDRSRSDGP